VKTSFNNASIEVRPIDLVACVQPQLDLFGERRRRETLFRKEQKKLLDQEYLRRA